MDEDGFFRIVALVAVMLMVLPAALPMTRRHGHAVRTAGAWVLIFGLAIAAVLVLQWWFGG
jgi:hypothetical protein